MSERALMSNIRLSPCISHTLSSIVTKLCHFYSAMSWYYLCIMWAEIFSILWSTLLLFAFLSHVDRLCPVYFIIYFETCWTCHALSWAYVFFFFFKFQVCVFIIRKDPVLLSWLFFVCLRFLCDCYILFIQIYPPILMRWLYFLSQANTLHTFTVSVK